MTADRWIELALLGLGVVLPFALMAGRLQAQARDTAAEVERLRKWRHDVIAPALTVLQGDVASLQERTTFLEGRRHGADAE